MTILEIMLGSILIIVIGYLSLIVIFLIKKGKIPYDKPWDISTTIYATIVLFVVGMITIIFAGGIIFVLYGIIYIIKNYILGYGKDILLYTILVCTIIIFTRLLDLCCSKLILKYTPSIIEYKKKKSESKDNI